MIGFEDARREVPEGWGVEADVERESQPQAWEATGAGWSVEWSPTPPHLSGMGDVFEAVRFVLGAEEWVLVTPTGPCLRASEAEPLAVWALLCRCAERPFKASGDVPRVRADRVEGGSEVGRVGEYDGSESADGSGRRE